MLYTSAHDPAPEGRCVLDYKKALNLGLEAIACEAEQLAYKQSGDIKSLEKIYFWKSIARVLRACINWANNYAKEARKLAELEKN